MTFQAIARHLSQVAVALLALGFSGCQSLPLQPPIDLSGPGWMVRRGQAVWQPQAGAEGIAGELLVAMHPDGRRVVEFTKTPLPLVVAQRTADGWQAQFVPRNKTYSGRGEPPARLFWLYLPEALIGREPFAEFSFGRMPERRWVFERLATGERLEGYLELHRRPRTHVVRSGDYVHGLALLYGTTVQAIHDANPGEWRNWFRVGNTIHLPPLEPSP